MPMTNEQAALRLESIICFESTAQAIMAEQVLLAAAFAVRVMPKPACIKGGCGFCLRFLPEDLGRAIVFLSKHGVNVEETYWMEEAGGAVSYRRMPYSSAQKGS